MTSEQLKELKQLAKSFDYGSGPEHSRQVKKLSLKLYRQLVELKLMARSENDRRILSASALLHNIGVPDKRHNETAFDILKEKIPEALVSNPPSPRDLSAVLYCVLWHRGFDFSERGEIAILNASRVRKLAGIVRIADALDRSFQQIVKGLTLNLKGDSIEIVLKSKYPVEVEIERAAEKAELFQAAFKLKKVSFA